MLLEMWCNSCVLADIQNQFRSWNEMKWETIWGAQSRVPRGSAQSRIGAWGPTPMQPLFDGTTQLATYVEKGWSCALLWSNHLCNYVRSLWSCALLWSNHLCNYVRSLWSCALLWSNHLCNYVWSLCLPEQRNKSHS